MHTSPGIPTYQSKNFQILAAGGLPVPTGVVYNYTYWGGVTQRATEGAIFSNSVVVVLRNPLEDSLAGAL